MTDTQHYASCQGWTSGCVLTSYQLISVHSLHLCVLIARPSSHRSTCTAARTLALPVLLLLTPALLTSLALLHYMCVFANRSCVTRASAAGTYTQVCTPLALITTAAFLVLATRLEGTVEEPSSPCSLCRQPAAALTRLHSCGSCVNPQRPPVQSHHTPPRLAPCATILLTHHALTCAHHQWKSSLTKVSPWSPEKWLLLQMCYREWRSRE